MEITKKWEAAKKAARALAEVGVDGEVSLGCDVSRSDCDALYALAVEDNEIRAWGERGVVEHVSADDMTLIWAIRGVQVGRVSITAQGSRLATVEDYRRCADLDANRRYA